jgi:hypothetical protein
MPQFCRHSRLIHNCSICSREQAVEPRPLLTPGAPRPREPTRRPLAGAPRRAPAKRAANLPGVIVRRPARAADDGFRSPLVPGLKSSEEARRLAEELAFAQTRLTVLAHAPPGLYAEVADFAGDLEERTWLAFLIAYLAPLEQEDDPFAAIRAVRTAWGLGETPDLEGVRTGPRGAHDPARGARTVNAYRAWAVRHGSQAAGLTGEPAWSPQRRFARAYERLALSGLHRDARFELLVSLGRLGLYELAPGALALGGSDPVTVAAKHALGIGDAMLLERRAARLAAECGLELAALDLGFYNWQRCGGRQRQGGRATVGLPPDAQPEAGVLATVCGALDL